MKKLVLLILTLGLLSSFATNDLVITRITRTADCTTLHWASHTGEFYTVYWTDNLVPPVLWRVGQAHVPSGGTNTTWREGCCAGESMMMSRATSGGWESLSKQERAEKLEAATARSEEGIKFLTEKLQATTNTSGTKSSSQSLSSSPSPSSGGETNTNNVAVATTARFYRVGKVPTGFLDGWGHGLGQLPEGTNFMAVAAGWYDSGTHNLALRTDGTVVAWGNNFWGQTTVPNGLTNVIAVAAGGRHSVALRRDGSVTNWGDNSLGQITNPPASLTNVVAVQAGLWHTLALRADGTVAVWGDLFNRTNAVPAGLANVRAISAGPRHCLALRCDGTVVAWGFTLTNLLDNFLPTNVPASLSNVIGISAGMEHNQALLADGTVCVWGRTNNPALQSLPVFTNQTVVGAGWHFGTALTNGERATLLSWGQVENDLSRDSIVAFSAGARHILVVRTNDQSPIIHRHPRHLYEPAGTATNLSVLAVSTLAMSFQWQRSNSVWADLPGETNVVLSFPNMQTTNDGHYRVLVSTSVRTNTSKVAQVETLQAPTIAAQSPALELRRPQGAEDESLFVIVTNHAARYPKYQWFKNGGALPIFMADNIRLSFQNTNVEGGYHVVVTNRAGSATSAVWQVSVTLHGETTLWGDDSYSQVSGRLRNETNLVAISAGGFHTLGLRENGTVVAWGQNNAGQINVPSGLTNVVAMAGGGSHSLALRENGTVRAWGDNLHGQTNVPTGLSNVTAIAAASSQSLALKNNGQLIVWGNTPVPAGVSNLAAMAAGPEHALGLLSNGTVQVWQGFWAVDLTPPAGLSNVVALACSYAHALALKKDGTVVAWGQNTYGEATPPAGLSNVMKIAAGHQFSLAMRNDGTVVGWGRNDLGQTNVPEGLVNIRDISAGHQHSASLAENEALEYPVNVSEDVLLIYNRSTNCPDSVTLKDYYVAHRPFMSSALQFSIDGPGGEYYQATNGGSGGAPIFTNALLVPLLNWYAANPTVRPRYIICFLDVPRWVWDVPGLNVGQVIRDSLPYRPPYVNYIDMGAPPVMFETNRLPDCLAYVDKLARFASNYSPGKVIISASAGGYGNDQYFFDDVHTIAGAGACGPGVGIYAGYLELLAQGVSSNWLNYTCLSTDPIRYGTNLAGYMSRGSYGWGPYFNLAVVEPTPRVQFKGNSEWYIMATVESYNGRRETSHQQADYAELFWSGSFGRTNYQATPVGTVGHVHEPIGYNVNDPVRYFGLWQRGHNFAFCAWRSQRTPVMVATGDPLVKR